MAGVYMDLAWSKVCTGGEWMHMAPCSLQMHKTIRTIEMKLKQNSFETVLKLFCFSQNGRVA